jgi:signal peptidase I
VTARVRKIRRLLYWVMVPLTVALVALAVLQARAQMRGVVVASASMENTIMPGNRLLAWRGDQVRRGDLVIFIDPALPGGLFLRRVIGLPGDHVACCNARGQLTVNGRSLQERYVYPGDAPSARPFSVTLAAGQVWLMGDHRSRAYDSRFKGPAAMTDIVGRVSLIDRNGAYTMLRTPAAYIADGLAPADHRPVVPVAWLVTAGVAVLALLVLLGTGIVLRLRRRNLGQLTARTA